MRIVQPSVNFIAVTCSVDDLGEEVASLTTPELLEQIGRTCYKSEDRITPGSAEAFLTKLLAQDPPHESVVEHVYASFRIVCDRGVSHELVRHRIASYTQESTRYCNYSLDKFGAGISVIQPPGLDDATLPIWLAANEFAEQSYLQLTTLKTPPQIARSVLPTDLKTEVVATLNLRGWRNFMEQRLSPRAHPQMREVAEMILPHLVRECPPCFRKFTEEFKVRRLYCVLDDDDADEITLQPSDDAAEVVVEHLRKKLKISPDVVLDPKGVVEISSAVNEILEYRSSPDRADPAQPACLLFDDPSLVEDLRPLLPSMIFIRDRR